MARGMASLLWKQTLRCIAVSMRLEPIRNGSGIGDEACGHILQQPTNGSITRGWQKNSLWTMIKYTVALFLYMTSLWQKGNMYVTWLFGAPCAISADRKRKALRRLGFIRKAAIWLLAFLAMWHLKPEPQRANAWTAICKWVTRKWRQHTGEEGHLPLFRKTQGNWLQSSTTAMAKRST